MTDKISRYQLQQALAADVTAALDKAFKSFELDPNDFDANRRVFRALVTVASARLLNLGAPPLLILAQAAEAISAEVKHRTASGSLAGQPFGQLPPASA
jgi:hypothetical protein